MVNCGCGAICAPSRKGLLANRSCSHGGLSRIAVATFYMDNKKLGARATHSASCAGRHGKRQEGSCLPGQETDGLMLLAYSSEKWVPKPFSKAWHVKRLPTVAYVGA